jgi:alpha/beta superfamily hydrolase
MPPIELTGSAGPLEAILDEPAGDRGVGADGLVHSGLADGLRAAVVLGHPHTEYGGTMHTKVVYQTAKALARLGCAVLRINFRGAGRSVGRFTGGPGELDDFRAALAFMRQRYPSGRLWAGGLSFGAWVGLTAGAGHPDVTTIFGIAPPLARYDFEAVRTSPKPKFFIQGERDEVCPLTDMREFYARAAEPKELVVIDGADHLFDGKVGEVADAIEDLFGDWNS